MILDFPQNFLLLSPVRNQKFYDRLQTCIKRKLENAAYNESSLSYVGLIIWVQIKTGFGNQ